MGSVLSLRTLMVTAALTRVLLLASAEVVGGTLSIDSNRFAIDGVSRFVVFVSYFDGVRRPAATLATDLDWLKSRGVLGVRVWPNSSEPRLMDAEGGLNATVLSKLKSLIDAAAARGMVVDVTFNREGVCVPPSSCGFTAAEYTLAIATVAHELDGRRNILFDLQNEWNVHGGLSRADLQGIRAAVRIQNPLLVVTASTSGDSVVEAAANAFDVLAYHGPRDSSGRWAETTDDLVHSLRTQLALTPGRVGLVYLQEPNRFPVAGDMATGFDSDPDHYWTAVTNAKLAGAAAWTFHTGASFNLSSQTAFSELLTPEERNVLHGLLTHLPSPVAWANRATFRNETTTGSEQTRAASLGDKRPRSVHGQGPPK